MIRPELYNIVEYSLSNDAYGTLIIEEPIGYTSDLFEIKKSKKNFSTITKYSTNLEFILKGANFIKNVYDNLGYDAEITLKKIGIHLTKSEVQNLYSGILDGYTYEFNSLSKILTFNFPLLYS